MGSNEDISQYGKQLAEIIILERGIYVKFDAPIDQINRRIFLGALATKERFAGELNMLYTLPDDKIETWDRTTAQFQIAQHPQPFTAGLYETILKDAPKEDRDKDVA